MEVNGSFEFAAWTRLKCAPTFDNFYVSLSLPDCSSSPKLPPRNDEYRICVPFATVEFIVSTIF